MNRHLCDYIALAVISQMEWDDDGDVPSIFRTKREPFRGDLDEFKIYAEQRCGFPLTDELVRQAVRSLAECRLLRVTDDNFSGTYLKVNGDRFADFIKEAEEDFDKAKENLDDSGVIERPSDYPAANAFVSHPLFDDYHELGDGWLRRALVGIQKYYNSNGQLPEDGIMGDISGIAPGSDRIVRFTDNEIHDFDEKTSEIIDAVTAQNQIDDQPGVRELIIGQLKAGRELIRAGVSKLHLLELTLIETLRFLAARYEREMIGGLAAALITALLTHIGID